MKTMTFIALREPLIGRTAVARAGCESAGWSTGQRLSFAGFRFATSSVDCRFRKKHKTFIGRLTCNFDDFRSLNRPIDAGDEDGQIQ